MELQGTILLADDEETFSKATQTLLHKEGYECHTVADAKELSMALQGNAYDLLITDLKMPGNRVMEMVDEVKAQAKLLPVIVVTGYPSIETAVDSVRLNVLEYIVKPIDYPHFLNTVHKGIQFKRQLQSARTIRDLAKTRLEQLENIEQALVALGTRKSEDAQETSVPVPRFENLESLLSEVVGLLKTETADSLLAQSTATTVPSAEFTTDYFRLREGLYETIQVLQQTKGSFRSRELANLRLKLQALLKHTTSEL